MRDPHALVVPDGTEIIREKQFEEGNHNSVFIPKSVVAIQNRAFANWKNLQKVVFEEGSLLKTIGEESFMCCHCLKNIQLPEGLKEIGLYAFKESGLQNIIIPSSVRTIH